MLRNKWLNCGEPLSGLSSHIEGAQNFLANRKALVGLALLAGFALLALFGPLLVCDPTEFVAVPLQPPSAAHWFGTTGQGQDVFAQTVAGARGSVFETYV